MTDFEYYADRVPGHKMCCICFEYVPFELLYRDWEGQKWDLCWLDGIRNDIP